MSKRIPFQRYLGGTCSSSYPLPWTGTTSQPPAPEEHIPPPSRCRQQVPPLNHAAAATMIWAIAGLGHLTGANAWAGTPPLALQSTRQLWIIPISPSPESKNSLSSTSEDFLLTCWTLTELSVFCSVDSILREREAGGWKGGGKRESCELSGKIL